ncbi:MAG: DUF5698 domain-containing protein [Gemmataceae bacterium]
MLIAFIFVAEMVVVTIATLRTIFIARGMKYAAPVLGFFEVSIWLFAIGSVMSNLSDLRCALAFALGFTVGNFLGMLIEQHLALGSVVVSTITHKDVVPLLQALRAANFGVTCLTGQGAMGPVTVVQTTVPRRELSAVVRLLERFDPGIFYTVDALQMARAGVVPMPRRSPLATWRWAA